jgi:trigger factor
MHKGVLMEEEKTEVKEQEWHHVVTMEDLGGLKRKLHIIYDVEAVKMSLEKACEIVRKKVQVKGYRKGKAPKQLVEKFHKDHIDEVSISLLSQEGFLHACYEQKISPMSEPKMENAEFKMDGTFSCDIYLEVKPTIVPSGYLGIKLKKSEVDLNMIKNQMLQEIKQQHMSTENKKEVKNGYTVTLDFWTHVDGKEISSGKDQQFVVQEGVEPPFGGNLIGAKIGEMVKEKITMPEEIPTHGGKEAEVNLDIKCVCEKVEPTNEELVIRTQSPSYEELMNVIDRNAKMEADNQQRKGLEEQVIDKLIEMHEFDTPETWVSDEEKYLTNQLNLNKPDEEMLKTIHDMAERNVKRTFILESIYDAEQQLAVKKEEVEEVLESEAKRLGVVKSVLKKDLKSKNMMDGVVGMIKHGKVMSLIISQAQFEEEKVNEPVIQNPDDSEVPENPFG